MKRTVMAAAAIAFTTGSALALEMTQVPAHVIETAKALVPGATWTGAGTDYDTQRLMPEYEIKGKTADGSDLEVDLSVNGDLMEIETVIKADAVPAAVMKTLNAYLPGFAPTKFELSQRPNGVNFYEFEGKVKDAEVDIEISADGKVIMIADDSAV